MSGRPGTFDTDAYLAALELVEEGVRLSTNLTSVDEVVDQLLLNTPVNVLRVAARFWLADQIRAEQGGGGSHD